MTSFTVETVMAPVVNDDWLELRRVTDMLPGTILLEDPEEPMLIIPIEAENQPVAALFAHGALNTLGLEIVWGRAYRTAVDDYIVSDDEAGVPSVAPKWLESPEATEHHRELADA